VAALVVLAFSLASSAAANCDPDTYPYVVQPYYNPLDLRWALA
jgi:hypothetical protein